MKSKFLSLIFIVIPVVFISCKKDISNLQFEEDPSVILIKNSAFPSGILSFKSQQDLNKFYSEIQEDKLKLMKIPSEFISLSKKHEKLLSSESNNIIKNTSTSSSSDNVDVQEFLIDMETYLTQDPTVANIVNSNLEVLVNGDLFKLTRIGVIQVESEYINNFREIYPAFESEILYNPNFNSFPNETFYGSNIYQVSDGITRIETNIDPFDLSNPILNTPGSSGGTIPCSIIFPSNYQYETYQTGNDFNSAYFNNFDQNRRFKFETFSTNFLGLGILRTIGIRGKVQRKRSFLGIPYWAESYADEIVLGIENMDLHTDYVIPSPYNFTTLPQPEFNNIINLKIGNHILEAMDLKLNLNFPFGQNINNSQASSFLNGQLNSLINYQFNDLFKPFLNSLIDNIDPTFSSRYEKYAKQLSSIKDNNKLRVTVANAYKEQGYSNVNVWRFDWNIGTPWGSGTTYSYEMKSGSFTGRARIGCNWYGIRIIKL